MGCHSSTYVCENRQANLFGKIVYLITLRKVLKRKKVVVSDAYVLKISWLLGNVMTSCLIQLLWI